MSYSKTNWQNLPDTSTPLSANNLNKIENELEILDNRSSALLDLGTISSVEGTYTTAEWAEGTATNCTWTAPKAGLYLMFAYFKNDADNAEQGKVYKQLQLTGTAQRIIANPVLYQAGPGSTASTASAHEAIMGIQTCTLVRAVHQGDTILPRIWTPQAGIVWLVKIVAVFLK